jgi:hypothetical protein
MGVRRCAEERWNSGWMLHRVQRERRGAELRARSSRRPQGGRRLRSNCTNRRSMHAIRSRPPGFWHAHWATSPRPRACEAVLVHTKKRVRSPRVYWRRCTQIRGLCRRGHPGVFEESNQAWLREQNEAIRTLLGFLPGPAKPANPPRRLTNSRRNRGAVATAWRLSRPGDLLDAIDVQQRLLPGRSLAGPQRDRADRACNLNLVPKAPVPCARWSSSASRVRCARPGR